MSDVRKPEPKKKRQQPFKIDMSFDEAMKKVVKAKSLKKDDKKKK